MVRFCLIAGRLALAPVAFVTLAPIPDRPVIAPAHFERFAAFFALGLLFLLAYPTRIAVVLLVVIGAALGLETLQLVTPDRHGRLVDALTKVAGGACGMAVGSFARGAAQIAKERIAASSR